MKKNIIIIVCAFITCSFIAQKAQSQDFLLKNGTLLTTPKQKAPSNWIMPTNSQPIKVVSKNLPKGITNEIEIDITKELKGDGYFCQYIKLPNENIKLMLTGRVKSSVSRIAYLQVKLFKENKVIKLVSSKYSSTKWSKLNLVFSTLYADRIQVLCRFKQKKQNINQKVWFSEIKLKKIKTQISLVGDSTVCNYPEDSILRGWGQMLPDYINEDVAITNNAIGGRSTKTFIKEKHWARTLAEKPNFILIQFGHNDSHAKGRPESTDANTDYKKYLRQYADDAKANGATAIFITPMHRRLFKNGKPRTFLKKYADAMKEVAKEKGIAIVDLYSLSGKVLTEKGEKGSLYLFKNKKDRTHFCEAGAKLMAELIISELKKQKNPIKQYLK